MKNIKACVFNAYGTILDTYLPFEQYRDQLGDNGLVIYKLWRSKRLQYSSQLCLMDRFTSYETITRNALTFACEVYGVTDKKIMDDILEAHSKLACYPDVREVLQSLKSAGKTLSVLSNGSPQKLTKALKSAELYSLFDSVYSTEQIKTYKPSPAVYEYVEEQLALPRDKICFVSSNSWDIAGAASYGFKSIWINRYNRTPEHLPYKADQEINELSDLAKIIT